MTIYVNNRFWLLVLPGIAQTSLLHFSEHEPWFGSAGQLKHSAIALKYALPHIIAVCKKK